MIHVMSYTPHIEHGMAIAVSVYDAEFCFHEVDYWLCGAIWTSDRWTHNEWLRDNIKTSSIAYSFAAMERAGGILQ